MLRSTPLALGSRAHGYMNRVMVYAHRRNKARYLPPSAAHVRSPLAHKSPEEYRNTWDPRSGVEWHNRIRRRGHYRHWPWARWTDDPIRHHQDQTCRRTVSAGNAGASEGIPEWNYYADVGQDYATPPHFPLRYAAGFVYPYTCKHWTQEQLQEWAERIEEESSLRTIADMATRPDEVHAWWRQHAMSEIPVGFLLHLDMVCKDILLQQERKDYRRHMQERGVLRTREMVRYYALPHLRGGPAMPTTLEQASGTYPEGKFTYMRDPFPFHPLQRPDGMYKHNMYPA